LNPPPEADIGWAFQYPYVNRYDALSWVFWGEAMFGNIGQMATLIVILFVLLLGASLIYAFTTGNVGSPF
jgi:hypothetical protein